MHKLLSVTLLLINTLFPVMAFGQAIDLAKAVGELTDKLVAASKGEVVGVEGDIIYINLGQKEGILEGNKLEVVRLGEPLRGGIGYRETIVGEVEVTRVRETASITKVLQKSGEIKEGDQVYQLRKKVSRMAVTEFPFGDKFNDLTRNAQDILYTNLIQKGMNVVEREKLEEVLREQKTGYSGVIDLSTAAQVGKMLGVEAVLVGSVSDLGNSLALIARLVDVEKGVALTAARAEVAKTPMLAELLAKGTRATRLGPAEASAGEKGPPAAARKSEEPLSRQPVPQGGKHFQDFASFRVDVENLLVRQDGQVVVALKYTNKTKDFLKVALHSTQDKRYPGYAETLLMDDWGNEYRLTILGGMTSEKESEDIWFTVHPGHTLSNNFVFGSEKKGKEEGSLFSLTSRQKIKDESGVQTYVISIPDIPPKAAKGSTQKGR